jgi:hypothetical protein
MRLVAPPVAASTRGYYLSGSHPQVIAHGYDSVMRTLQIVIGLLLVASGLVWIAQGLALPFAPRSFMTADRTWIMIGAMTALGGALLAGWGRRRD